MLEGHHKGYQAIKAAAPHALVGVSLSITDDQAVGPDSQRDAKAQAILFLQQRPEIWKTWVRPEVAARIDASVRADSGVLSSVRSSSASRADCASRAAAPGARRRRSRR